MTSKRLIADCIIQCGISKQDIFDDDETVNDEFKRIKKSYFGKVRIQHPDKGGDAEVFKETQSSFEILRDLFRKELVSSFADYLSSKKDETAEGFDDILRGFRTGDVPSYEYYEDAAEEEMPRYRVEKAKSGRSQCVKCKTKAKAKPKAKAKAKAKAKPKKGKKNNKNNKPKDQDREGETPAATCSSAALVEVAAAPTTLCTEVTADTKFIAKNSLRFGSLMNDNTGTYTHWHHLKCWRVPSKVWSGFTVPENADIVLKDLLRMDEVLLSGLGELSEEEQREIAEHVMDRSNWARKVNRKKTAVEAADGDDSKKRAAAGSDKENKRPKIEGEGEDTVNDSKVAASSTSTAITIKKQRFNIPKPGENGAIENKLKGKRFVLTGVFPMVGGGKGLNLGKDKSKKMIESFGGVVTGSISGKTDYLIVGKQPGGSKVGQAKGKGVVMMDIRTIQKLLMGETEFKDIDEAPPPTIESFSAGYNRRALLE